jgi:hypothetical protein
LVGAVLRVKMVVALRIAMDRGARGQLKVAQQFTNRLSRSRFWLTCEIIAFRLIATAPPRRQSRANAGSKAASIFCAFVIIFSAPRRSMCVLPSLTP